MRIPVINIGNSRGIRIPKAILEQYGISNFIELIFEKERIILKPDCKPRKGWDELFEQMHKEGDDQLKIDDVFEDEEFEEWK